MSFESPLPPYNASDPSASFLNSSCLDLLLIEIVPLSFRLVREIDLVPGGNTNGSLPSTAGGGSVGGTSGTGGGGSVGGNTGGGNGGESEQEQEERDAVFFRLEGLGYRVGQGLVERFSRDRPRFTDTLDVIKFLCKDLWMLVFRKQIDNLKTNHRDTKRGYGDGRMGGGEGKGKGMGIWADERQGVYVLTDNNFRPFARMSTEAGGMAVVRAQPFLWFPCGIIRGALASMGINATVQAETSELPGATFQIKSVGVKA
ncbi:Trafficking protein particle complex subunit 6B [Lachnellula suecica]|uniref:Trafficking protein particle complex subunit 6B n=1 Tax=Lachnellula suecica TaxID=602035 RepID=A0A8T9C7U0_9HELO|nr:Trafficking protein particle complex subunit 6B [Lachnellula suecica]